MVFDVRVLEVNDPPTVSIRVETLKERLEEGDILGLAAEVMDNDTDREDLHFTWLLDGKDKGNEVSIVLRNLGAGEHHVELQVNDGDNVESATYDFSVEGVEEPTPWGAIIGIIVVIVVALVVVMKVVLPRLQGSDGDTSDPKE
jgi:hypothetical protein